MGFLSALVIGLLVPPGARAEGPFSVAAFLESRPEGPVLRVAFEIPPPNHFLYADALSIEAEGDVALRPLSVPEPETVYDRFSEEEKHVYRRSFEALYALDDGVTEVGVIVRFQGCDESVCFFPEERTFHLALEGAGATPGSAPSAAAVAGGPEAWRSLMERFEVAAVMEGYLSSGDFIGFLDGAVSGERDTDDALIRFRGLGILGTILVILIGGMGLNLTPCVLPLIPINLAIIGAGAKAGSKGRGFALGGAYGLGMAMVYGVLGLLVVLTGSKFGALNSSPWFNLAVALVFVLLALAMFEVITIDLSRFQSSVETPGAGRKGHFLAAFTLGGVAALLAGACVAPVLISVLLLAGNLYSKGNVVGLLLPFLLGLGMGLPWPFAGAGLSVLPKPGTWMKWVKYAFGVVILVLAVYYAHLSYQLFRFRQPSREGGPAGQEAAAGSPNDLLADALRRAEQEQRPVFIDFWATWCKNCLAMEKTTFADAEVKEHLRDFVVVKYQAEVPNRPPAKDVLDHFGSIGLPTYVVLKPNPPASAR